MKKAVKINNVIGVVEEVGKLTYSVRVEDDNYYYLDIIVYSCNYFIKIHIKGPITCN